MRIDGKVDYAAHELQVKHLLKEVHKLLLNSEYVAAASTIDAAIVELRLFRTAVKSHIRE